MKRIPRNRCKTFKKYFVFPLCIFLLIFFSGCAAEEKTVITDTFGTVMEPEAMDYDDAEGIYKLNGYAYLTESSGKAYSTIENPELFEEDVIQDIFTLIEMPEKSDFSLTETGTEFNGLTLREASVEYQRFFEGTEDEKYEIYRNKAYFDGTATLNGYIRLISTDDVGYWDYGEIIFCAADGGWEGLPMIWSDLFGGFGTEDQFMVQASAPTLSLGMIDDYGFDTSAIPEDGSVAYVEVTITDLYLVCAAEISTKNTASLVSVKAL